MNFDFAFFLTMLVLITGVITLLDVLFFAKKRKAASQEKVPFLIEQARAFFPVFLAVWIIRSFIVQPYRVPTGSLMPTVEPGDFIIVNQFAYGLRLPVLNKKILSIGEPKVGDIALFRWPVDESMNYVKRVLGTPGDHVVYKDKKFTINGKEIPQEFIKDTMDIEPNYPAMPVQENSETLPRVKHRIFIQKDKPAGDFDLIVPEGKYFMVGDNRDNSQDSRAWGFVPEENLIGKAFGIWMSWDSEKNRIRWNRIGKKVE